MPRGRKPNPKTGIRRKIKKLKSEIKANQRSMVSLMKKFDVYARKLGALEKRAAPITAQLERAKEGYRRLELNNSELRGEVAQLEGLL